MTDGNHKGRGDERPMTADPGNKPDLSALLAEANDFAKASRARSTNQAREYDWKTFTEWCASAGVPSMPASVETAIAFLVDQVKTKATATLIRYRWSIGMKHKEHGHPSPFDDIQVQNVFEGIKRTKGMAQTGRDALDYDAVAAAEFGTSSEEIRNRALVLFGFMTASRAKEICALDIGDLEFSEQGVLVRIKKSKTDKYKKGRTVSVPRSKNKKECPVEALEAWLALVESNEGPVFRSLSRTRRILSKRISRGSVWDIVKDVAAHAGLEGDFGAHSLRVGYVTRARANGVSWDAIREQTGHVGDIVKRYSRYVTDPFEASHSADVLERKK